MSCMITNTASPEAGDGPDPGIVPTYKARLQALGYSPSLTGKCIRTILHLIAWLSANGIGIETLDIRVLHRFLNHDCACPGPRGYRKNLGRARWHLHRFLGFLMETGRVRMPPEIETGGRVVEAFLQTLTAQGYVTESLAAYRKRCRHFIVWLYLHDVALAEIDDDVFSRFLAHDCTCAHPDFFIRTGRFAGCNNSRSKIGLFIDYLIGSGIAPPRPTPAREEPGQYVARFLVWLRRYRGIGERTIKSYHKAMQVLLPHLGDDPDRYSATLIRNTVQCRLDRCGLSPVLIALCRDLGLLYADRQANAVFLRRNAAGEETGTEILPTGGQRSGAGTDSEAAPSPLTPGSFWMSWGAEWPTSVLIAKNAIDALSVLSLQLVPATRKGCAVVSAGALPATIPLWIEAWNPRRIFCAYDATRDGDDAAHRLLQKDNRVVRVRPALDGDDWNDMLMRERCGELLETDDRRIS